VKKVKPNLLSFNFNLEHEKKMSDLKNYVKTKGFQLVGEHLIKNAFGVGHGK
jgi:hypothetical protein